MKVKLDAGVTIDTLNKDELDDSLGEVPQKTAIAIEAQALRGIKYTRIPRLYGSINGAAIVLGENSGGQFCGPDSGYAWSIKRLAVNGLASGATPDILNIYRNGVHSDPVWQLNGNSWSYTFGKLDFVLLGGEFLLAQNVGALAATGQITLTGEAIQVPQEFLGKLA